MKITGLTVLGDSGVAYTVAATEDGVTCTCPAFKFRAGECKHINFVRHQFNAVVMTR